jgi:hypothetical protein
MTGKKLEKPLYLDMDFGEALTRFTRTDPKEVEESMRRAKEAAGGPAPDDPTASKKRPKPA